MNYFVRCANRESGWRWSAPPAHYTAGETVLRRPAADSLRIGRRHPMRGHGFEKSTFGTAAACSVAWKYFRCLAPVTLAVSTAGNRRMYALYDFTASL